MSEEPKRLILAATPMTNLVSLLEKGQRYKRRVPRHHTAGINGFTGGAHSQSKAKERRLKQMERAAWNEFEHEQREEKIG